MTNKRNNTTVQQRIFLLIFGIFIIIFIELLLRLADIPNRNKTADPFVGFEKVYPLFGKQKRSDGELIYATNNNKLSFFNYQEFLRVKPKNTFRIFCFGGSTTYGRPFKAETAFPRWLEIYLNLSDNAHQYEVINAGGISYASNRIVHLVEEAVQYQPDLFIIYCGHNEFLEARTYEKILQENQTLKKVRLFFDHSRLYSVLRKTYVSAKNKFSKSTTNQAFFESEVTTILDASAGLERYTRENLQRRQTIEHFQYNLEKIVNIAKNHNIDITLATVTSNLKDFSPFKSEHKDNLSAEMQHQWDELFRQANLFQQRGQFKEALALYQRCYEFDNQFAELAFRIAQCLYETKQYALAGSYYMIAKELDICPLRAPAEINYSIRSIAQQQKLPLANIAAEFVELCPHKIPDSSYLIDHVHPTIEGNQIIAQKIAAVLEQEKIVPIQQKANAQILKSTYKTLLAKLSNQYFVEGTLNLAKVLGWAGKEKEKIAILKKNSSSLQNNFEYHYMYGNSLLKNGDLAQAKIQFQHAIKLNPEFSQSYTNLGFACENSGQPDEALKNYKKSLQLEPKDYVAQTNIGRIYYIQNEFEKAKAAYKKAISQKPDYPDAHEGIGVIYYAQGNFSQALKEFTTAIELNPNYAEAFYNLGLIYLEQQKIEQAIEKFNQAIKNEPNYADAYSNLGVCYYHQHKLDLSIKTLEYAIALNPNNAKAHNNLAVAYHSAGQYALARQQVREAQQFGYKVHPDFIKLLETEPVSRQ